MNVEDIQQIFFAECEESLTAVEAGLDACHAGTHDEDTVHAVFRAVHSIKGGAGAFGHAALQAYAHGLETLLSDVRDGSVALDESLIGLLLRALDLLSDHVHAARYGEAPPADGAMITELAAAQAGAPTPQTNNPPALDATPEPREADGFDNLDALLDDICSAISDESAPAMPWTAHIRPHAGAMANGAEPLLLLRELERLGGRCTGCRTDQVPPLEQFAATEGYLEWTFAMPASVDEAQVLEVFEFVADDCSITFGEAADIPAPIAAPVDAPANPVTRPGVPEQATAKVPSNPPPSAPAPTANTPAVQGQSIRIDLAKLDRLIDAVGELVIAQAMIAERLEGSGVAAGVELDLLETLTRDIQESAMAIRAQPIGSVFNRVPRILRELAASTGKHVRLEVSGETTELDKTVIERLGEPLTHLIRNAVDHGIEPAEERIAAGKDPEGTLTLSAEHRSGRICIRIADDGRGIDRDRVLAKAIEKGLISPDAQLSPEEIDLLIFAPGFSTAASVTSVSGRGVGMDVVRQNVKELGGRIVIDSEAGRGTAILLTLPLTLAIAEGMIVMAGDSPMVVPLTHVVECLSPDEDRIQHLGARAMFNMRGQFIPVVPVAAAIGAPSRAVEASGGAAGRGVLIVVETEASGQAALLVDRISDQRQFVIKSLATHFRAVKGIAGATILGDGHVALIVDVDGLVAGAMAAEERLAA